MQGTRIAAFLGIPLGRTLGWVKVSIIYARLAGQRAPPRITPAALWHLPTRGSFLALAHMRGPPMR